MLGAMLVCLALATPAHAQQIDNRAVFYLVLEAWESAFVAHTERIEQAYGVHTTNAAARFACAMAELDTRRGDLLRGRSVATQALLNAEQALNTRIAEHNQQTADTAQSAQLAAIQGDINAALAAIRAHYDTYAARLNALHAARVQLRTLAKLADRSTVIAAFSKKRDDYLKWLADSQGQLTLLGESVKQARRDYDQNQVDHAQQVAALRTSITAYNDRATQLNTGGGTDADRAALRQHGEQIEQGRIALDATRKQVIAAGQSLTSQQRQLKKRDSVLQAEKSLREQALLTGRQLLLAPDQEAAHARQRDQVQALANALRDDYGSEHVESHQALAGWLAGDTNRANDPGLQQSHYQDVITKVQDVTGLRSKRGDYLTTISPGQHSSAALTAAQQALTDDIQAFDERRQQHIEEFAARLTALNEEIAAQHDAQVEFPPRLKHGYELRLQLSENEFALLQQMLSAPLRSSLQPAVTDRRAAIRAELDLTAAKLEGEFPARYLRTDLLFDELAKSEPGPAPADGPNWFAFRRQISASERELTGTDRRKLIRTLVFGVARQRRAGCAHGGTRPHPSGGNAGLAASVLA